MIMRTQELRLMSRSLAEVALRLSEPETLATEPAPATAAGLRH